MQDEQLTTENPTQEDAACEQETEKTSKTSELTQKYFEDRAVDDYTRRNGWISNLFFVAVLVFSLLLMYQLSRNAASGNEKTLQEIFANLNTEFFILALAIVIAVMTIDALKYFIIMHATVDKLSYTTAIKVSLLGKFYDNITPFSSGGQPFQIHYLYKKGLSGGESTAVIFIKFCFNMMMWLSICFVLMVFNRDALTTYVTDTAQRNWFTALGWVGFSLNCALPLVIIAFAVFPKMMETITRWVLTLGHKLKLVRSEDAVVVRAKRVARDFRSAFALMWKKPLHAIALTLCCICEPFLSMSLPYFVVVALGGDAIAPSLDLMLAIMTLNVYVSMSVSIVPTPGNSGAMENVFLLTLTSVAEGVLFWSVFTWKFLTYHTYVIIGLVIVLVDFVRKHRIRSEKSKKA